MRSTFLLPPCLAVKVVQTTKINVPGAIRNVTTYVLFVPETTHSPQICVIPYIIYQYQIFFALIFLCAKASYIIQVLSLYRVIFLGGGVWLGGGGGGKSNCRYERGIELDAHN